MRTGSYQNDWRLPRSYVLLAVAAVIVDGAFSVHYVRSVVRVLGPDYYWDPTPESLMFLAAAVLGTVGAAGALIVHWLHRDRR